MGSYYLTLVMTTAMLDDVTDAPEFGLDGWCGWARLYDVYDGDTIKVLLPAYGVVWKVTIRLEGIDAPELRGSTREDGLRSRDALLSYLTGQDCWNGLTRARVRQTLSDKKQLVWLKCSRADKYGRTLATVYNEADTKAQQQASAMDFLMDNGYAKRYTQTTPSHPSLACSP